MDPKSRRREFTFFEKNKKEKRKGYVRKTTCTKPRERTL